MAGGKGLIVAYIRHYPLLCRIGAFLLGPLSDSHQSRSLYLGVPGHIDHLHFAGAAIHFPLLPILARNTHLGQAFLSQQGLLSA